jgi:hypothetical protein
MLASGVTYYPPPLPAPPAYTPDQSDGPSPLLDITVDKIIGLIRREKESRASAEAETTDVDEDEDEVNHQRAQSANLSTGPPSPLARRVSKRRRNTIRHSPSSRSSSPDEWPFKKELASVLDCDVCAMMLYDPVTTPCQHVSQLVQKWLLGPTLMFSSRSARDVSVGLWTILPGVHYAVKTSLPLRSSRTTRSIAFCFPSVSHIANSSIPHFHRLLVYSGSDSC